MTETTSPTTMAAVDKDLASTTEWRLSVLSFLEGHDREVMEEMLEHANGDAKSRTSSEKSWGKNVTREILNSVGMGFQSGYWDSDPPSRGSIPPMPELDPVDRHHIVSAIDDGTTVLAADKDAFEAANMTSLPSP